MIRTSSDDATRGVSEVIGFVLVFSLITMTVGVVYVTGFGGLQDLRDAGQMENAERAFDVLADNINDQHESGARNRATEIKLNDAAVRFADDDAKFVFSVTNVGSFSDRSVRVSPIVYSSGKRDRRVIYSAGTVFRAQRQGASVRTRPPLTTRRDGDDRMAVLAIPQTREAGGGGLSGSSTVLVRSELALREVLYLGNDPTSDASSNADSVIGGTIDGTDSDDEYAVTFRVETTSVRAVAWEEVLESELSWREDACTITSPGTVECRFPAERVAFTVTRIDVSIDR